MHVSESTYWTERELSQYLGVSVATLRRWRASGEGPPWRRFGRLIRYARADVDAWAAAQPSGGGGRR